MPSAQVNKILKDLERHAHIFDLDRDGLGEKLLDSTMEVQMRDFDNAISPDGTPWPPLSPAYEEWKAGVAMTTAMGYLYGVMATEENFRGERFISATEARSAFGVSEQAKDECDWFSAGDPARNRPPRPFIGLSAEAIDRSHAILTKRFNDQV